VLTPHDGEFARLFGRAGKMTRTMAVFTRGSNLAFARGGFAVGFETDRTRRRAALSGAAVILKRPDTVAAHPPSLASIAEDCRHGSPRLALAMSCGNDGRLLRKHASLQAASAAVWLHGAAARHLAGSLPRNPGKSAAVLQALFAEGILQADGS